MGGGEEGGGGAVTVGSDQLSDGVLIEPLAQDPRTLCARFGGTRGAVRAMM